MGWLQIRGTKGVPWFMDRRARKFIKPLITHEGYCFDLGESEDFALSIGPASANGFVRLAKGVDFTLYRDSFYKNVSESDQENLTEWAGGELTECFERGFLDYIHIWVETLKVAAQRQQGLLIQWG